MLKSGDRFFITRVPLTFPTHRDFSSFKVIRRKVKLLDLYSSYEWRFLTNDGDNGRLVREEVVNQLLEENKWTKIEDEFPSEFRFEINEMRHMYRPCLYNGLLDDKREEYQVTSDNNIFYVKKEELNFRVKHGDTVFFFSYDKMHHKIKEGAWKILS